MRTNFFLDIDGTCADATRRFEAAGPEPSRSNRVRYSKWVSAIQNEESLLRDQPVSGMPALARALSDYGQLVYLTSREERWRKVTQQWLDANGFPSAQLMMRPNGNWSETHEFKEIAISMLCGPAGNAVLIDDDEHGTLEVMCKKNRWTFLKARSGGQK